MIPVQGRAVDYQGRSFVIPSAAVAIDPGERLALATITGTAYHFGDDRLRYDMAEGAVDLSLVRTGRCPLLGEHIHHLSSLLGRVEAAAVQDGELKALVRFAGTPAATEVWSLVEEGFPVSLSAGGTVEAAEWERPGLVRARRWRLREISVCVFGRDENARLRRLAPEEDAAALVRGMNPDGDAAGARRAAVRAQLKLDDWVAWSRAAAPRLARRLGVDLDAAEAALAELVLDRVGEMMEALA